MIFLACSEVMVSIETVSSLGPTDSGVDERSCSSSTAIKSANAAEVIDECANGMR
jgi:hypothetical protein